MIKQSGGSGAVKEPITTIADHGVIERLTLPEGFVRVDVGQVNELNNYFECAVPGTTARICYEETHSSLYHDDLDAMEQLFAEQLPKNSSFRRLNLNGNPAAGHDDGHLYAALCQCFVFGGRLVADGASLDETKSVWELHTIRDGAFARNFLLGRLKFQDCNGKPSRRQALMVIPDAPGSGGTGYIWLEGTAPEIARHEDDFFAALAAGEFRQLIAG